MKASRIWMAVMGVLLVVAGAIGLLEIGGIIDFNSTLWQILVPALFAVAGAGFLVAFATNPHDRWPAVIPGLVLLGLGIVGFFDEQLGGWSGPLFLGSVGLAFLLVYLARREFWWALIPMGALFTLALVAGIDAIPGGNSDVTGSIFFLGLAATFLAVSATRAPDGRWRKWALIPAVVLAALGVLVLAVAGGLLDEEATWWLYIGPALLILGGAYIVFKAFTKQETPESGETTPAVKN